jgi:hypothetical protein
MSPGKLQLVSVCVSYKFPNSSIKLTELTLTLVLPMFVTEQSTPSDEKKISDVEISPACAFVVTRTARAIAAASLFIFISFNGHFPDERGPSAFSGSDTDFLASLASYFCLSVGRIGGGRGSDSGA